LDSDALRVTCFSPLLYLLSRAASKNCSRGDGKRVPSGTIGNGEGGTIGAVVWGVKGQAAEKLIFKKMNFCVQQVLNYLAK